jgi:5,5'-dehydrodivanillate O-demethylase oxygenase subunit
MLTQQENDRLTRVGPGTPMGELLRRYWHPIASATELEQEPVQYVRLLGEDLVLFKSEKGDMGLIGRRCAHRNMALEYGIPQENGLRCPYHGWTFDTQGRCVDMPFEPATLPLKIPAYKVQELGGLIFAYLGPEPAPLLPKWDMFVRTDLNKSLHITPLPCNWLQCMDNSLDPIHFEHLHGVYGNYVMKKLGLPPMLHVSAHQKIEFDVWEYGIYKRRQVEGQPDDDTNTDWTIGHPIIFPNILAQGGPDQISCQIRVPVDDTNTLHFAIMGSRPKAGEALWTNMPVRRDPLRFDAQGRIVGDTILPQDELAWVGQGPITDRTTEHLVTSDKGIALYHKLLLENIEKVERGEEPMAIIRDPEINEPYIPIARGSTYTSFRRGIDEGHYGGLRNLPVGVTL